MNMYLFFKNLNILCIFSDRFFDPVFFWFFSGSGSVPVFGVDRFGSGNIALGSQNPSPPDLNLQKPARYPCWKCYTQPK
jgi:hypothetical protein